MKRKRSQSPDPPSTGESATRKVKDPEKAKSSASQMTRRRSVIQTLKENTERRRKGVPPATFFRLCLGGAQSSASRNVGISQNLSSEDPSIGLWTPMSAVV